MVRLLLLLTLVASVPPCPVALSTSSSLSNKAGSSSSKVRSYDVVIIGGGSAGLTAAKVASTFGKSSVIVEQGRMGGDCTWTGCVPSKSLIAASKAAHTIRTAQDKFGGVSSPATKEPIIDMKAIKDRVQEKIQRIYDEDDSPEAMKKLGIDTVVGKRATFVDKATLKLTSVENSTGKETDEEILTANMGIIVATGASPMEPSDDVIQGLSKVPFLTYEDIFELEEIPKRMTIIGGGPIGCELAQAFARLGSTVTQVANRLLPKEEPEVSEILEQVFASEGIKRCKGRVTKVEKNGKSGHEFTWKCDNGNEAQGSGDMLLVAVGRKPNTRGFGLEDIGVTLKSTGHIETNDKMQTSVKTIYAAGDCTAEQQFTHYAGFQGGIAARNIVLPFSDKGVKQPGQVPSATFTSPEASSIGLTEAQAKEQYGADKVDVAKQKMSHIDRAICEGEEAGLIKIVYHKNNYQILGATVMGPSAGELISEIGVAMSAKMSFDKLSSVTHAYPTYSIALQIMATDALYEKTLKLKGILNFLKKLGL